MSTNTQVVKFQLNDQLETKVNEFMNSEPAQGFEIISTCCPPVVDGNIYILFVIQKKIND